MLDSGAKNDSYEFELYEMTLTQYVADDFAGAAPAIATMTLNTDPATDGKPRADAEPILHVMSAERFLVLKVASAPAGQKGGGLTFYADGRFQY
jgi:hypothetical protein